MKTMIAPLMVLLLLSPSAADDQTKTKAKAANSGKAAKATTKKAKGKAAKAAVKKDAKSKPGKSKKTKSQKTKSQKTKSQKTKSQKTKSQKTKSQKTKSKKPQTTKAKSTKAAKKKQPRMRRFIFFAARRPVVFGVRISLDGNTLDDYYNGGVEDSYKYADSNSDKKLSTAEFNRVPWRQNQVASRVQRSFLLSFLGGGRKSTKTKTTGPVKYVSKKKFMAEYARRNPRLAIIGATANTLATYKPLFDFADQDSNGELTAKEISELAARLASRDFNDDETISHVELNMLKNPFAYNQARAVPRQRNATSPSTLMNLDEVANHNKVIGKIISEYGATKKGSKKSPTVPLTKVTMPQKLAKAIDKNGSQTLDRREIERYLRQAPVQFVVEFSHHGFTRRGGAFRRTGQPSVKVSQGKAYAKQKTDYREITTSRDRCVVFVSGAQIEFDLGQQGGFGILDFYKRQFKGFDRDNNGYLDRKEAGNSRGIFSVNFNRMDRDGDGKLFQKEFEGFMEQHEAIARKRATLIVSDLGRHFFPLMDANGDGRISKREFTSFNSQVWDENKDKKIDSDELPQRFKFSIGRGQMPQLGNIFFGSNVVQGNRVRPQQPRKGPLWFKRLDRNLDGDISPREFPGNASLFAKFDKDKNGLIDAREAQSLTPKRKPRKKKAARKKTQTKVKAKATVKK